jgi:hypothetical protein
MAKKMEIKLTMFISKRYEQNMCSISKPIATLRNWSTKLMNMRHTVQRRNQCWHWHWCWGCRHCRHVVVEAADVGEEVLIGKEVVGIRGEEEASTPKNLSHLSRTRSQEAGFCRRLLCQLAVHDTRRDGEDSEVAQSFKSRRHWWLCYVWRRGTTSLI